METTTTCIGPEIMQGGSPIFVVIFLFMMLISFLVGAVLPVIAFWKICSKAGFPGALGLLMLVPLANIVLPVYLAFAQWPVLKGRVS